MPSFEILSENKNRKNKTASEIESMLKEQGFLLDKRTENTKYRHPIYKDIGGQFPNFRQELAPGHVKNAYEAMKNADERAQSEQKVSAASVNLYLPNHNHLMARREDDQLIISHREFPDLSKTLRPTDFSEKTLMRSAEIAGGEFQPTLDGLKTVQEKYGIKVKHEEGFTILTQPLVGIEKRIASSDFVLQIAEALAEIDRETESFRVEREFDFHLLSQRGYQVDEEEGMLVIKDLLHPARKEIRIATDFATMTSKQTVKMLGDLHKGHPVIKEAPAAEGAKVPGVVETAPAEVPQVEQAAAEATAKQDEAEAEQQSSISPADYAPELLRVAQPDPSPISIPETPAQIPQEPPVSAPSPDTQPVQSASASKRPSDAIFSIASPLYELMTRLRHERKMTEQDLAYGIKNIVAREERKAVIFTEDLIDEWQHDKAFIKNNDEWKLLCQVLILDNPKIPESEKQREVDQYGFAHQGSRGLYYNTDDKIYAANFGTMTSRYRRQLGLVESQLATILTERYAALNQNNLPTEDIDALDYQDIARIQIGAQKASSGLIKYMICALNEHKNGKIADPLSDEEKADLQALLEKVPARTVPAKNNIAEEDQVTPEGRKMRAELLAMFKENGTQWTQAEVVKWGRTISPTFSYATVSNYLSVDATRYQAVSPEKAEEIKGVLTQVLQTVQNDPAKLQEFSQKFDTLTEKYMAYKKAHAKLPGFRPKSTADDISLRKA